VNRKRLCILGIFALFGLFLVGGELTGFAIAAEPAASEDVSHVGMLLLLVAGLLFALETHQSHKNSEQETQMDVV
jgi:hypothetical protein